MCVDHTLVAIGNGEGGLVLRTLRLASHDFHQKETPPPWSPPSLVLSSLPSRSGCVDERDVKAPCPFDGKPWAVRWRGRLMLYVRANAARNGGARHVHVSFLDEQQLSRSANDGVATAWSRLQLLNISGVSVCPSNNIYFFAVFADAASSSLLALFPAVLGNDAVGGIYASTSSDGIDWARPRLILPSKVWGQRTTDYPVAVLWDGADAELWVEHSISIFYVLEETNRTKASWQAAEGRYTIWRPYVCRYRVRTLALLGDDAPPVADPSRQCAARHQEAGHALAFGVRGAPALLVPSGKTHREQLANLL